MGDGSCRIMASRPPIWSGWGQNSQNGALHASGRVPEALRRAIPGRQTGWPGPLLAGDGVVCIPRLADPRASHYPLPPGVAARLSRGRVVCAPSPGGDSPQSHGRWLRPRRRIAKGYSLLSPWYWREAPAKIKKTHNYFFFVILILYILRH
jgi:hypothetical protein